MSGLPGFEQAPVVGLQLPTKWHESEAVQVTGLPLLQAPSWQVSASVQAFPSLHALLSGLPGFEHAPVAESQTPAEWHESEAVHVTGLPLLQAPSWQVSACVQALPSLHALPSGMSGFEQTPVAASQTPAEWH